MEFLDKVLEFIATAEGASLTIAVVVEFVLRMIKSEKPLSVLYLAANVIKKSGEILVKIGNLLDKILPQRLK
jgi:DNA-binding HxlR family transcriptional regulator